MKSKIKYIIKLLERINEDLSQDNSKVNYIPGIINLLEQQMEEFD